MKKVKSKTCLRCGAEKGDGISCNHWGTSYKKHIFTYMEAETKEEKKIEHLEFRIVILESLLKDKK